MRLLAKIIILVYVFNVDSKSVAPCKNGAEKTNTCGLSHSLIQEIDAHAGQINYLLREVLNDSFRGETWRGLSTFINKFGPRLTGSKALEDSIDYVLEESRKAGLENVNGERVKVPHWVRGNESATLLRPWKRSVGILGLGYSIGTPKEGITAKAIVVNDFDELKRRAKDVPGKIVVFNEQYKSFLETGDYITYGPSRAAALGAVATLIRSVAPFSLYTPHTGILIYDENVTKIPAACITIEDAELFWRLAQEGEEIEIHLQMEAQNLNETESRNVVAELVGTEKPDQVVVISGHIDSWDIGEGAMDDAGGSFISWYALRLLKHLNYRPRRTVRMIMWTGEEMGFIGAQDYIKKHKADEGKLQFVMESDLGTFEPLGLKYTTAPMVKCILERVLKLLRPMGDLKLESPHEGPDIYPWIDNGVPGATLWTNSSRYFWFHHTNADSMILEDPENLDKGTALFAAVAYVLADLSIDLPRNS